MSWTYKITSSYGSMTEEEKQRNATAFWAYMQSEMTIEAAAGILGNMERESYINPGQLEGGSGTGRGLIQWTPGSVLTSYAAQEAGNWYDGNLQCALILDEGYGRNGQGGRWLPTTEYSYSWVQFCQLTDVAEACKAYLYERERAGVSALQERLDNAAKWYTYLSGQPAPDPPTPPTPGELDIKLLILKKKKSIYKR